VPSDRLVAGYGVCGSERKPDRGSRNHDVENSAEQIEAVFFTPNLRPESQFGSLKIESVLTVKIFESIRF